MKNFIKRYGKHSEWFYGPVVLSHTSKVDCIENFHVPNNRNYQKFQRNINPGDFVYVIIYDKKTNKHKIKKDIVYTIEFFDYDKKYTLWQVWLYSSVSNTGLKEDEHYFTTFARAKHFMNKIGTFQHKLEIQQFWQKHSKRQELRQKE